MELKLEEGVGFNGTTTFFVRCFFVGLSSTLRSFPCAFPLGRPRFGRVSLAMEELLPVSQLLCLKNLFDSGGWGAGIESDLDSVLEVISCDDSDDIFVKLEAEEVNRNAGPHDCQWQ